MDKNIVGEGLNNLLEKFIKNPTLVLVFFICFVTTPFVIWKMDKNKTEQLKNCQDDKYRTDSLMLEFLKSSSKNEGIIEALNIVTEKD